MSKKDKLLQKFLEVPIRKDLTYSELESLLLTFNFLKEEGRGSRIRFIHTNIAPFTIHKPHPSNILKIYIVKEIQKKLKKIL